MVSCQEQCHDKLLTPCTVLPSSANRIAGYCALLGKSTLKNSSVIWKMSSLGCLLNGYGRIKNHVPLCWSWLKPVEIHGGSPFFFFVWEARSAVVSQLSFTFRSSLLTVLWWGVVPPTFPKNTPEPGSWAVRCRDMRQVDSQLFCWKSHSVETTPPMLAVTESDEQTQEHVGTFLMPCSSSLEEYIFRLLEIKSSWFLFCF